MASRARARARADGGEVLALIAVARADTPEDDPAPHAVAAIPGMQCAKVKNAGEKVGVS